MVHGESKITTFWEETGERVEGLIASLATAPRGEEIMGIQARFSLNGKVALVTGSGRGIGAMCAQVLAEAGAKVVVTDVEDERGTRITESIVRSNGYAVYYHLDVTREEEWLSVVGQVVRSLGGLDVVVNNAGIQGNNLIEHVSIEQWRKVMAVNLEGVFLGTKHAILAMKPGGIAGSGGSIINMCSVCGIVGIYNTGAYCASKGAVRMLTKVAAIECGKLQYGIRVNSVVPGVIRTELLEIGILEQVKTGVFSSKAEGESVYASMHPIGRLGDPVDVAYAVLYLSSDASRFVTGSELVVDGGYTAQ